MTMILSFSIGNIKNEIIGFFCNAASMQMKYLRISCDPVVHFDEIHQSVSDYDIRSSVARMDLVIRQNVSQIDDASKRHNIIYFTRECNTRRTSNNSFPLVKCIERHPVFFILYFKNKIRTTQIWNISFVLIVINMIDRIKRHNQVISIFFFSNNR